MKVLLRAAKHRGAHTPAAVAGLSKLPELHLKAERLGQDASVGAGTRAPRSHARQLRAAARAPQVGGRGLARGAAGGRLSVQQPLAQPEERAKRVVVDALPHQRQRARLLRRARKRQGRCRPVIMALACSTLSARATKAPARGSNCTTGSKAHP